LTFQGHETSSVTIRFGIGNFLLVVLRSEHLCPAVVGFRDIQPQTSSAHRHILNRHCACAISRDVYPLYKI